MHNGPESLKNKYSHYYSGGLPFVKTIEFVPDVITKVGEVVVGSITYDIEVDIIREGEFRNMNALTLALADAINGNDGKRSINHNKNQINPTVYARILRDSTIQLFGREPNDDFTLTSTVAGVTIATVLTGTAPPTAPSTAESLSASEAGPLTLGFVDNFPVDISTPNLKNHVFTFTLASVGSVGHQATVGILGKAGSEAIRSQQGDNLATITANGRRSVNIANIPLDEVALTLISEVGGPASISDIVYKGSA